MKSNIEKYSIGSPYGSYTLVKSSAGQYKSGQFVNKSHTVLVYAEPGYIQLSIYIGGIGYYKAIRDKVKEMPSDLSLSRQASKFSKEVLK